MRQFILITFVLLTFQLLSQGTEKYNSRYASFYSAEELFTKQQFASARIAFREFLNSEIDANDPYYIKALYYEGISALELFNNDAIGMLENFNRLYPESIYKHEIYFRIGKYYYQKKDYKTTLVWFNQLAKFQVAPENLEEYFFKLGYSQFELGNFVEARNAFYEVKGGNSIYSPAALYYYSHIAYQDKSYQTALEGFEKLVLLDQFKQLSHNYIVQIYYRMKRYQEVVRIGPMYLDSLSGIALLEMNHLIGDAYFELGKFDEAVPYLTKYNQNVKTKREDDYQLAYALYKSSSYTEAIELFDQVSRIKDTLGQISLYHIGESYLKLGNNTYARTAFEAASFIPLNAKIQEDALYNYAILSYKLDLNPYDEAIEALELYLEKYPNSDRKKEVYEYLLNVFTSTSNYRLALKSLDKIPDKDIRLQSAYQMIAYNQGVDYHHKSQFDQAILAFQIVPKYNIDDRISANAIFWTSDAYFQLKKYDKTISSCKEFLSSSGAVNSPLRKDAIYNMAYAYFSRSNYVEAIEQFRLYLQETNLSDKAQKSDVLLRIADAYYTTKQNDLAIKYYNEQLELNFSNQDHALYYLAKTYGYKNDTESKIKQLLDLINNYSKSKYIAQSIYDVGLSYRYKNEDAKALKYFEQLCADYPNSNLIRESQIEMADIYFKEKNYEKSEALYRQILGDNQTNRNSCARIVKGIVEIYKAQRQPEKIDALVEQYPCADFTVDDQEELYYNTAIEPYMDSSFQESIPNLEKYLSKFPKGKYTNEIKFYLANSHFQLKNEVEAIRIYREILETPSSDFTELAAIRVSKYLYNNSEYNAALPYYLKLEKTTSRPDVAYNTVIGIMRCNFLLENWNEALEYSTKVLSSSQISNAIKIEAEFAKGMALFKLDRLDEAIKSLEWVVVNANNVFGAEAKFTIAEIYFKKNDPAKAEIVIKELLKMKPAFDFWIAKSLMLQSKILIAKKDLFQAEYTLKSVIDHYPITDDGILTEANQMWDELMQIKNKPKQVEDPGAPVIEIKENGQ